MMDININVKKCDLLVFNSPLPKVENKVYLGDAEEDIIRASTGEIRYLGVWLAEKKAKFLNKQRIIGIRDAFIQTIGKKSLSIAHVVYLVNKVLYLKIAYLSQTLSLQRMNGTT